MCPLWLCKFHYHVFDPVLFPFTPLQIKLIKRLCFVYHLVFTRCFLLKNFHNLVVMQMRYSSFLSLMTVLFPLLFLYMFRKVL